MPPDEPGPPYAVVARPASIWHALAAGAPSARTLWRSAKVGLIAFAPLLVVGLLEPRRLHCCNGGCTKTDAARLTVAKYEAEAYPTWLVAHPDAPCPSLVELNEYMNNKDTRDPWGTSYVRACYPAANGRVALVVWSAGEDGRFATADDIRSDS